MLKFLSENNMINLDDVRNSMREQERQRLLAKHKYKIFQSTDGRWRTDLPDETKKRKVRTIAKSSLEKLEDAIVEFYAEQEDEQYIVVNTKDTVDSLRKLFPKWLVYKQAHTNSATYIKRLISDWNRFYDQNEIADMELKDLTRVYLDMWLHNTIKEYGLTRNAYYNMSTILKQSLEYACMDGVDILQKNPMAGMKVNTKLFVKKPKPKSETQVFLRSEQKLVAEECSFRVNRNPNCTTPIAILLNFQLGLRIGELVALKWSDIDSNYINICRSEVEDYEMAIDEKNSKVKVIPKGYKVVDFTKSDAGMRSIYLNSEAKRLLEIIRNINDNCGYYSDNFILISIPPPSAGGTNSNESVLTLYVVL